jgi:hypothetical protein
MSTQKSYNVKVDGTNLVRDTSTMGLSNRDITSKNEYYAKVQMLKTQKHEINNIKVEMNALKEDISEIKELLVKLLSKG